MPLIDYISQAKAYLRERLSAEISFQNNLEALIEEYAYKLVDIAYNANVPPNMFTFSYSKAIKEDVDEVIGEMKQLIVSVTETLAIGTHNDNKKKILTYIGRDISGSNFYGRLDAHTDTFKKEMEGVIAAGLLIGALKTKVKQSIKANLHTPYQNTIFKEAVKSNLGSAEVLVKKGLHIGIGISNSAFNSINSLGRFTISDAWMQEWYDGWDSKGAIGYDVRRGSSYPCSLCDSNVGFHTDGNCLPIIRLVAA